MTSKPKGEGLGLRPGRHRGQQGGKPRSQGLGLALLPLTSSLLTSMFHTAIPPSEEQETSCLVS